MNNGPKSHVISRKAMFQRKLELKTSSLHAIEFHHSSLSPILTKGQLNPIPQHHSFFNPLHLSISIHIFNTALYTFHKLLTRRVCLTIKSFFSWWLFPLLTNNIQEEDRKYNQRYLQPIVHKVLHLGMKHGFELVINGLKAMQGCSILSQKPSLQEVTERSTIMVTIQLHRIINTQFIVYKNSTK